MSRLRCTVWSKAHWGDSTGSAFDHAFVYMKYEELLGSSSIMCTALCPYAVVNRELIAIIPSSASKLFSSDAFHSI
jgi:hypothetical protein